MIDSRTGREIQVSTDGTAPPYIMVPEAQLPRVRETLDQHGIDYWVESHTISVDGKPAVAFINLSRSESASKVQAILDGEI